MIWQHRQMEQLFGAIPNALGGLGSNAAVNEAVIFAAWKRCAGSVLARRAVPIEFFENRLVIAVEDQMWRRHLEELSPQMIARINGFLNEGMVRFIEFRVEPGRSRTDGSLNENASDKPSSDVPDSVAQAALNISDVSLRASFLEAASEYLARQKADQ